ncbi:hydroxyacid dehydrogenase [Benzoatithermus flavus]|uniref:Hydroxyacid dehydrogenase n=1 Tax=Benzoatithermus flavus TaxID=3108223 RepID=A0ABU8XQE7_9PROT
MPHVLVVGHIRQEGLDLLRAVPDVTVEVLDNPNPARILAAMPQAEAVIVRTAPIVRAMIEAAPRLRIVSRHGVGYDNVDLVALNERRIPLAVAATANMIAVAEHAFFMMLELAKLGRAHDRAVRAGDWDFRNRFAAIELCGKRLLVVGFGRIGRELARRAKAFGMTVAAFDPKLDPAVVDAEGVEPEPALLRGLARADVVSLHLPLGPDTRGLIGREQLRAMRPNAILINTARGGLVDETALAEAVREGWIRGAGLDVFETEPPRPDSPLLAERRVLLSPHCAGVTGEAAVRMAQESARNALAAFSGSLDPAVLVNPEVLTGR